MCKAGIVHSRDKAVYAFFSDETRKPLKLKLKSEKNTATLGGKTSFMYEKRCFLLLISLSTEFVEKVFPTLILFMRLPAIRQKKMNKNICEK